MKKDTKILQAILDGQAQIRKELIANKESLEKKVEELGKKLDGTNNRIDKIGAQLA